MSSFVETLKEAMILALHGDFAKAEAVMRAHFKGDDGPTTMGGGGSHPTLPD